MLHGHSHDGVACNADHGESQGHAHGEDNSAQPVDPQSGLPINQRAKNILAGNWRGQLTTIVASTRKACAHVNPGAHKLMKPAQEPYDHAARICIY